MAAEVKAYQAASNCRFTALPSVNNPNNVPSPYANPFTVAPEYDNGACMTENQYEFHTEWSDGNVHAAGFTTAWPPEQGDHRPRRRCTRGWTWTSTASTRSSAARPSRRSTRAAITPAASTCCWPMARSRFVKSTIDGMVWRALGTVAGGEVVSSDAY